MGTKGSCKADSCDKEVRAKGFCDRHYRKWRKGLMGKPRHNTCHTEKCTKPRQQRGLCDEHFQKEYGRKPVGDAAAA